MQPAGARSPAVGLRGRGTGAFTITELLVVIGIIVLLLGILLPAIVSMRKSARRTQIGLTLQSIATALEAYKTDFGDYPRLPPEGYPTTIAASGSSPAGVPGTAPYPWGSQLLCWALMSPANDKPSSDGFFDCDGADGPGFRVQRSPTPGAPTPSSGRLATVGANGKVYGPYLDSKFRLYKKDAAGATDRTNPNEWMIADPFEHPILYYPGHPKPGSVNVKVDHGYVWEYAGPPSPTTILPMFNATHNDTTVTDPYAVTLPQLLSRLDGDATGKLLAGKQAHSVPYLLWSAGPDGVFGAPDPKAAGLDPTQEPKDNRGADDVTNLQP